MSRAGLTTLGGDDPHYDTAGQIECGRRFAEAAAKMLQAKK